MYNNELSIRFLVFDREPIDEPRLIPPLSVHPPSFLSPPLCLPPEIPLFRFLRLCISTVRITTGHLACPGVASRRREYSVIFRCNGKPEATSQRTSCVVRSERTLPGAVYIIVHIRMTIDCNADEFADCTIYDCIGSIKRNENARATRAVPRDPSILPDSALFVLFVLSSGGLRYSELPHI